MDHNTSHLVPSSWKTGSLSATAVLEEGAAAEDLIAPAATTELTYLCRNQTPAWCVIAALCYAMLVLTGCPRESPHRALWASWVS